MPEHIRRPGERRHDDDVVAQLARCHDRIREFSALALRLPPGEPAGDADLAEAAASVLRYFTVALPRHERDEEDSLAPALRAAAAPAQVLESIERMVEEHRTIGQVLADGDPLWTQLAHEPERRADLGAALSGVAQRLKTLLDVHLPAEEQLIFPAVAGLPREVLDAIRAEMRARRDKDRA